MQTPRKPVPKALSASTAGPEGMGTIRVWAIALLVTATPAIPCAAQQARSTPQSLPNDTCAACFAYLEFPSSLEPGSYAMRRQALETTEPESYPMGGLGLETTAAAPATGKLIARFPQQTTGTAVSSKQ